MPPSALDPCDIAVLGAGCAGLTLAVRLVREGLGDRRLVLVDPRRDWTRDRTWCFWTTLDHPFAGLETASWNRWEVRADGRSVVREWPGVRYVHLPADAVYRAALDELATHPGVTVLADVAAHGLAEDADGVTVTTSHGPLRAGVVVDTRPPSFAAPAGPRHLRLLQHFLGWQVVTARPVFDPSVVTLMDFDVPQSPGAHFTYVLPFSPTEALVEDTHFSPAPLPEAAYAGALAGWLDRRAGPGGWAVRHTERGVLPMSQEPFDARPSRRVHRLGLAGGAARPATGYGFLAIQRSAAALAPALLRDPLAPVPPVRAARTEWLDAVFLEWLDLHPAAAPAMFLTLFDRTPPARLVRFLSEQGGLWDDAAVVGTLARAVGPGMVAAATRWSRRRAGRLDPAPPALTDAGSSGSSSR